MVRSFRKNLAARGLAIGDFDNDGSVDVLVAVNNGAPVLIAQSRRTPEPLARRAPGRPKMQH